MPTYKIQLPDGTVEAVPEALAADAVKAGGKIVGVEDVGDEQAAVTKYGRRTTTSDPEAAGLTDPAAARLSQIEGDYANSFSDEGGQAFLEGALRSVTAGLLGGGTRDQDTRAAVNPGAAMGGELVGLVGPGLVGVGAPGLAAKAGATAARGVTSTVGKLAVEGTVDALTYATTRESIGAIVHDKPFSVEAIAVEGALGAGIGAGLGAAAKGAGVLRKALTKEDIAKDTVARIMSGVDQVPTAPPVAAADGAVPPVDAVPPASATPEDLSVFDSGLPEPSAATAQAPGGYRQTSTAIKPIPALENPKTFYSSQPHMQRADEELRSIWKDIDDVVDDVARLPGDTPGYDDILAEWRSLEQYRATLAKRVGAKKGKADRIAELQRSKKSYSKWELPESPIAAHMDQRTPAKNQELIDAYQSVIASASKIDDMLAGVRARGEIATHMDVVADVRGASARTGEKLSREEQQAAVRARRADYAAEVAGRDRSPSDELLSEIFARDTGSMTAKATGPSQFERTAGVRQTANAKADSFNGYTVPEAWNKTDARAPDVIIKAIKAGEPPHVEEILMLGRAEQRAVMDSLSQKHIDSLAAEAYNSPKIIRYKAKSQPLADAVIRGRKNVVGALEEDMFAQRFQAASEPPPPPARPNLRAATSKQSPVDGIDAGGTTGIGVIDMLRKTNMAGIAMAAMFPRMAVAKMIVEKYGARIAGAAEKALSNRAVGLTLRKIPALPWANLLAPGGSEHDRNLRAIAEAAKNPAAFDAAIEKAMSNIDSDNPEKMVEARERISTVIQYLIRNMPPTLSSLKQVWSPSSIGAFNLLVRAAFDPVGVFEDAATAPTEQINAAKEMYPETYMHWMTELVGQVSKAAAEGRPIPRHIGRFLPVASPAWSPDGMAMLQTVKTEKVQGESGGQMNASVMAPKTDVEAMSQNRIGLNK